MIAKHFESPEDARKAVSLEAFAKFKDTKAAMDASTELIEGKLGKSLKKFLKKNMVDREVQAQLAVYDKTLGAAIQKKLGFANCLQEGVKSENLKKLPDNRYKSA